MTVIDSDFPTIYPHFIQKLFNLPQFIFWYAIKVIEIGFFFKEQKRDWQSIKPIKIVV